MPISKTDFVRGLQCEKMLWLDAHKPELKQIPPEVRAKLDAGNAFGDGAMSIFGDYVETTTYKSDGRLDYGAMLAKTQKYLAEGVRVICEGAFSWYGNYCAVDILKKEETGYRLYEVKNADAPRTEFLVDLGFQRLILRKCGVALLSSSLVLQGEKEGEYKIVDVTEEAKRFERVAENKIFAFGKIKKKDAPLPDLSVGAHCENPYRCWYFEHCHQKAEQGEGEKVD